uniref:Transcription initiation factor IIF subunit alpha n=1 Tax=Strigamia maritima TaxID=126957 RepID=T1JLI2_STRMM
CSQVRKKKFSYSRWTTKLLRFAYIYSWIVILKKIKMSANASTITQEFAVRVPKNTKKRYNVMRFHGSSNIDVTKWSQVKMERENNMKDFKTDEDMPKFGAGSEYGREQREEARRKKYGITLKKYNTEDQPWILKPGGKAGKKFRGVKEGGIATNAAYYVFVKAPDGAFEAFPVEEWYNFTPVRTYKTLNAEEAEEEFGKRDTVYNYFTIMKKRLKNNEEEEKEEDGEKPKKKKGGKYGTGGGELKISDMDEWIQSSEEETDEEGATESANEAKKNAKKNPKGKKGKKKKNDSDEEAQESGDGDEEGREVDYISDESSSEEEGPEDSAKSLKGVEDEEAIRKMEDSDTDEENPEEKKENPDENKDEPSPANKAAKEKKDGKKRASSSESSSDTSDSDDFDNDTSFQSALFVSKSKRKEANGSRNSRSNTPTTDKKSGKSQKRKLASSSKNSDEQSTPPSKKSKSQTVAHGVLQSGSSSSSPTPSSRPIADLSGDGITEEAIRRYLMRKPMTTTEILQKLRNKKSNISRDQLVNTVAQVLKRLDPEKQTVKGKMYLSLKQI